MANTTVLAFRGDGVQGSDGIQPRYLFGMAAIATAAILVLRLAFARKVEFCGGADACFYYALADQLAQKHGYLLNFVWNYQVAHPALPSNALQYWRPGTSFLLDLAIPFGGVTLKSSAVVATLATLTTTLSAAFLAWTATQDRIVTFLAYLLCLCLPPFWTMPLTPDSGTFYAVAVAWFLALFTPRQRGLACDLLGIACAGLAYFIRNDAVLLGAPFVIVLGKRMQDQHAQGSLRAQLRRSILLSACFAAAFIPTHIFTYLALGRVLNSSIVQVLFFKDLDDFYRYGSLTGFASWLSDGIAPLVKMRLSAFAQILHHLLVLYGEPTTLLALVSAGFASTRRGRAAIGWNLLGPLTFLLTMVVVYVVFLPAIAAHAVLRSYEGFLPALAVLAAIGTRLIATSRRKFAVLSGVVLLFSTMDGINAAKNLLNDNHEALIGYLMEAHVIEGGSTASQRKLAMVRNPAPFTATTGIASIPIPTNGTEAVRQAAKDFGVTHVVADKWNGGIALAQALHAQSIRDVPNTEEIVIFLPRNSGS